MGVYDEVNAGEMIINLLYRRLRDENNYLDRCLLSGPVLWNCTT